MANLCKKTEHITLVGNTTGGGGVPDEMFYLPSELKFRVPKRCAMRYIPFLMILFILASFSCQKKTSEDSVTKFREKALKLSQDMIILDSHIDWPERIYHSPADISVENIEGDFDLVRARRGGLNAALSVIYIPPGLDIMESRIMVDSLYGLITNYPDKYPGKFAIARTPDDIIKNFRNGTFSLPLCLENGAPIGNDLGYIKQLKARGITYITLCHSKSNQISDSNYDSNRPWSGISPFGFEVIKEMNRQGIIIDISHSTDSTVFQALRTSTAPIVATHSSCRYFTPGFERNLSDTLIKAIAHKNGVVMIGFGSMFLDSACSANISNLMHWFDSTGIAVASTEGLEFIHNYGETHKLLANAEQVVDHIDHVVKIAGIDYVGLGSDFDGVGPSQPIGLPDVSGYPVIITEMLKRGYTDKEIEKVLAKNFLRVWNEVLEVAKKENRESPD
jgi:membrane dipeptidase